MKSENYLPIGRIAKAHGIKGLVLVELDFGNGEWPENTLFYLQDPLFGFKPIRVLSATARSNKSGFSFFVQFEQINDRHKAEQLTNAVLFGEASWVESLKAAEVETDPWIDFEVFDHTGVLRGVIIESTDNGHHDVALIKPNNGKDPFWFPLVDEYVEAVDEDNYRVTLLEFDTFATLNNE
jgi:16S rRNA processing protein RimM